MSLGQGPHPALCQRCAVQLQVEEEHGCGGAKPPAFCTALFWAASLTHVQQQEHKNKAKKKSLLFKAFKVLKTRDEGCLISIPDAVCMVAGMVRNVRYSPERLDDCVVCEP